MKEELQPMVVVGGQTLTVYSDKSSPLSPKVIIPQRDTAVEGEVINVWVGDVRVATHQYRPGDFFPIHTQLDKEALAKTSAGAVAMYEIVHLDGTKSQSPTFHMTAVVFDSKSSFSSAPAEASNTQ
ncbi:hypothetical protein HCU66_20140 [Pseudomonas frederiksbergensis]|uniref:hypothetical protein n=1 Tax=Pseudomonas frederiksbergensis TaxID=104087 RepID=UPI00197D2805|nr:hypothetical protein [Pseudomonas frederiksbergensis]MBN3864550.1 hypothetical protein [Pseudomonas frederiksbergensis]